jgi:GT2 family glycosyltransferase
MSPSSAGAPETVAAVVVTFNRAELLDRCLDGLAASARRPDAVYVVDNASTDRTREVIRRHLDRGVLPLRPMHAENNLGGAGGFHLGVAAALADRFDRVWLMDDDVVAEPECLEVLMAVDAPALMAVREDRHGRLCEKAATHFDLRNPLAIRPKRESVEERYGSRAAMPALVPLDNVAFEGFMVRRDVLAQVGLPDPTFFIFYDDVDLALRIRRAGHPILAVRDAVLVRQLDFDQQHDTRSWKGYYMYRNLFVVHVRYGENVLVRLKPFLIAAVVATLAMLRGRRDEASSVLRAIRDAPRVARGQPVRGRIPGPAQSRR